MSNKKERVFSAMQPTGELHIGNYLGALKNWISLIDKYDCIYGIVDYHSITIKYDVDEMKDKIKNVAIDFIASGLDPKRCTLFVQSYVMEHTELQWILNSVTPIGELERMTQFKDKAKQHRQNLNAGLLIYPVLQTADIILYSANKVPVGEDQVQHVELAREIARNFNNRYGNVFVEPKELLSNAPRIKGLDGKAKMSKSLDNHISLRETDDTLKKKLGSAFTDENRKRKSDPGNPDICNIFTLHKYFTDDEELIKQIDSDCRNAKIGCVDCKKILHKNIMEELKPIQDKQKELIEKPDYVMDVLTEGGKRCREIAKQKMGDVKKAMGLYGFED